MPSGLGWKRRAYKLVQRALRSKELQLVKAADPSGRMEGRDWPADAETMVGTLRLDNLQSCIKHIVDNRVPGDLIETGVWRGGASIFMRAALIAYGDDENRTVWLADSFEGLPKPAGSRDAKHEGDDLWRYDELAVSVEEVKANFQRYGLLDDRVRFLAGWFADTLPQAPVGQLALMRLDGDMYDSTMVALESLYPKLSVGGFVVVDDYGALPECQDAVDTFRQEQGITDPIQKIDWTGAFWQRSS